MENVVECPFCGRVHNRSHPLLNVICDCGSKYYAWCNLWLDRTTGEYREGEKK